MNYKSNSLHLIIICFVYACFSSCTSPTSEVQVESTVPDGRITSTFVDSLGNIHILSVDPDDWQIHISKQINYILGGRQFDPSIIPAYPNPASDSISIIFSLGMETIPSFKIYNEKGMFVKSLFKDTLYAGYHAVVWHLDNEQGQHMPEGYYRCVYSWNTRVCSSPPEAPCDPIDVTVSGHGDIKIN